MFRGITEADFGFTEPTIIHDTSIQIEDPALKVEKDKEAIKEVPLEEAVKSSKQKEGMERATGKLDLQLNSEWVRQQLTTDPALQDFDLPKLEDRLPTARENPTVKPRQYKKLEISPESILLCRASYTTYRVTAIPTRYL